MNKQRIDQIAVQIAHRCCTKYDHVPNVHGVRYGFSDVQIADFANALAASPEYLQAILPDGVEDAKVWCLGYNDQKLGLIMSNPSFYKPELEAIVQNNVSDLVVLDLYPASAILAATAPLKAEIERLHADIASLHEQLEEPQITAELFDIEQDKVKVLTDALEKIAANKHQSISLASMPPIDQRAYWAEQALANVRGK